MRTLVGGGSDSGDDDFEDMLNQDTDEMNEDFEKNKEKYLQQLRDFAANQTHHGAGDTKKTAKGKRKLGEKRHLPKNSGGINETILQPLERLEALMKQGGLYSEKKLDEKEGATFRPRPFDPEEFKRKIGGIPESHKRFSSLAEDSRWHHDDKKVALDADMAILLMYEAMKNRTKEAEEYEERVRKLKEKGFEIAMKSFDEPKLKPRVDAAETCQVDDLFDPTLFIAHLRSSLVQLGFMRLPFCLYEGCQYDDISYNDLEEIGTRLDRYKEGLSGAGPRQVTDADEERMKRGMRIAISRLKEGELGEKRAVLKKERLLILEKRIAKLQRDEIEQEKFSAQIMAAGEDDEAYENPDLSGAIRPILHEVDPKKRLTQSVLQFFAKDGERTGVGRKTVSNICKNALDPKKNELRTMANLLKKIHQYPQGLEKAVDHYITQHLTDDGDMNASRAERSVLEELQWFYENDHL